MVITNAKLPAYIFISIWFIMLSAWQTSAKEITDAILTPCEKSIHLFDLKPEGSSSRNFGYAIHYSFTDEFPSKKAFTSLQDQLIKCGWKPYNGEFAVNTADWINYLMGPTDAVMAHRFARNYIDQSEKRLAIILIEYLSKASSAKDAMRLDKPNNKVQHITLQFSPFNEEEYKKKFNEYKKKDKKNK